MKSLLAISSVLMFAFGEPLQDITADLTPPLDVNLEPRYGQSLPQHQHQTVNHAVDKSNDWSAIAGPSLAQPHQPLTALSEGQIGQKYTSVKLLVEDEHSKSVDYSHSGNEPGLSVAATPEEDFKLNLLQQQHHQQHLQHLQLEGHQQQELHQHHQHLHLEGHQQPELHQHHQHLHLEGQQEHAGHQDGHYLVQENHHEHQEEEQQVVLPEKPQLRLVHQQILIPQLAQQQLHLPEQGLVQIPQGYLPVPQHQQGYINLGQELHISHQKPHGGHLVTTQGLQNQNLGGDGQKGVHTLSVSQKFEEIPIAVPQPVPVVVPRPVPVPVAVPKPVEVPRPVPIEVLKPVPVPVERPYPVTVTKHVPVPIPQPVYVKVPQPVAVPVEKPYPVVVTKPYPVKVHHHHHDVHLDHHHHHDHHHKYHLDHHDHGHHDHHDIHHDYHDHHLHHFDNHHHFALNEEASHKHRPSFLTGLKGGLSHVLNHDGHHKEYAAGYKGKYISGDHYSKHIYYEKPSSSSSSSSSALDYHHHWQKKY